MTGTRTCSPLGDALLPPHLPWRSTLSQPLQRVKWVLAMWSDTTNRLKLLLAETLVGFNQAPFMPLFVFFSFATSFMVSIMFGEKPFVSFCPHPHTRPCVYKEKTYLRHSEQSWVQKTVASSPTLPPCFSTCLQKCWVAGGLGCSDGSHIAKSHRREEEEGEENLHEKLWIPFSQSLNWVLTQIV